MAQNVKGHAKTKVSDIYFYYPYLVQTACYSSEDGRHDDQVQFV